MSTFPSSSRRLDARAVASDSVVERFIEAFLYESVNDVRFRGDLDCRDARTTCAAAVGRPSPFGRHARSRRSCWTRCCGSARPNSRRPSAHPALTGSVASGMRRDLPRVRSATKRPGWSVAGTLRHLVRSTDDPRWAEAVASSDLCLEHLVAMMGARDRPSGWNAVERSQLDRLARLRTRLIAHADHSAHDKRHLATLDERDAVDEAARSLGGAEDTRPHGSSRSARPTATSSP